MCNLPSLQSAAPVMCAVGKYSAGTATTCTDCDAGYVCPQGSTQSNPPSDICPLGSYCESGTTQETPCPAGKYGHNVGLAAEADCTECPQGYYCLEGTAGIPTSYLICPRGHYCPAGTGDYKDSPCSAGEII